MTEPTKAAIQTEREVADLLYGTQIKRAPFRDRKFSDRTIDALLAFGIDAPERLLFMEERDLREKIPGIGKVSLAEIMAYRSRFRGE
jgi:hypothetical protein